MFLPRQQGPDEVVAREVLILVRLAYYLRPAKLLNVRQARPTLFLCLLCVVALLCTGDVLLGVPDGERVSQCRSVRAEQ